MPNKMLIDASHPEETRVVVLRGNKVQEFDFEAADKKPLRGNIYLAKVTRVEPSLQAAFVDYGGNRHGFLAFAEIHPDYYQIPVADRIALLEEESRAHLQAEDEEPRQQSQGRGRRSRRRRFNSAEKRQRPDESVSEAPQDETFAEAPELFHSEAAVEGFAASPVDAPAGEILVRARRRRGGREHARDCADRDGVWSKSRRTGPRRRPNPSPLSAPPVHETLSVDPSGFGVVELGTVEEGEFQAVEQDHEVKARRQDERDEEAERQREARRAARG